MDRFEYLMVVVAIVPGLGMTQLLRGLGKLARGSKSCLVVILLIGQAIFRMFPGLE